MAVDTLAPLNRATTAQKLQIDFLFLDLTTCGRCLGTEDSLDSALEAVRAVLDTTGIEVEVNKVLVESAEQARVLRFVSSPTIRVDGHDIAPELRESSCESCSCSDGCGEQIACRVWVYRGEEHTARPVAMVADAILREVYGGMHSLNAFEAKPYELPENLARFFSTKPTSIENAVSPPPDRESCCDAVAASSKECCG